MADDLTALRPILAPTGRLRAAMNFGNSVLTRRGATLQESGGVAVEIARELARRLGVPVELIGFETAGAVVAVAKNDVFDVTFLARDPERADLSFTAPYVLIEGGYMVRNESPLHKIEDVDKPGIRMTVGENSAYDLYLKRNIKHAEIVRAATGEDAVDRFMREGIEVAAGVKAILLEFASSHSELRVMDGRFMVIEQAMATVRGPQALRAISTLIEELKRSGFVARELAATGQTEAVVAPAAPVG